jgi:hypothetical protein
MKAVDEAVAHTPTAAELEMVLEPQRKANAAAGRGNITDRQVMTQQKANAAKGPHGPITNAEVEGYASLASLKGALEDGEVLLAASIVRKGSKWLEPLERQLEAVLSEGGGEKVRASLPSNLFLGDYLHSIHHHPPTPIFSFGVSLIISLAAVFSG